MLLALLILVASYIILYKTKFGLRLMTCGEHPQAADSVGINVYMENIFKRLYRVETSRNMKTGGHGLGLAIARELAHQLGGEITVTSQYGLGSTFTLLLSLSGNENKA